MRGFIYFLPGHRDLAINNAIVAEYGGEDLRSVLRGLKPAMTQGQGPDGAHGVLVTHPDVEPDMRRCDAASQEWRKAPGHRYWVGMWREAPPRAAELLRPGAELVDGLPVELGGQAWLVPVARRWTLVEDSPRWFPALETTLEMDDEGEISSGDVVPRLAGLWLDAQAVADDIFNAENSDGQIALDPREQFKRCVRVLATNYRLGIPECNLLKILTTANIADVLRTLVDLEGMQAITNALVKKNSGAVA